MTSEIIGTIPKSDMAEIRISTSNWKGRSVVDLRVWYIPKGNQDYVPSRKGITIDSSKMKHLVNLLNKLN